MVGVPFKDFVFDKRKGQSCIRDRFSRDVIIDKTGIDLQQLVKKKKKG